MQYLFTILLIMQCIFSTGPNQDPLLTTETHCVVDTIRIQLLSGEVAGEGVLPEKLRQNLDKIAKGSQFTPTPKRLRAFFTHLLPSGLRHNDYEFIIPNNIAPHVKVIDVQAVVIAPTKVVTGQLVDFIKIGERPMRHCFYLNEVPTKYIPREWVPGYSHWLDSEEIPDSIQRIIDKQVDGTFIQALVDVWDDYITVRCHWVSRSSYINPSHNDEPLVRMNKTLWDNIFFDDTDSRVFINISKDGEKDIFGEIMDDIWKQGFLFNDHEDPSDTTPLSTLYRKKDLIQLLAKLSSKFTLHNPNPLSPSKVSYDLFNGDKKITSVTISLHAKADFMNPQFTETFPDNIAFKDFMLAILHNEIPYTVDNRH